MKKDIKAELIESGTYKQWGRSRKRFGVDNQGNAFLGNVGFEVQRKEYLNLLYGEEINKKCYQILDSVSNKHKRIKKKQDEMLSQDCPQIAFLTLTFNDWALALEADTRRQKVRRSIKKLAKCYVANIDFGAKKGREHYHALVDIHGQDVKKFKEAIKKEFERYGFVDVRQVGLSQADTTRTNKYLNKLGLHSIKDSTKGLRLIYSRDYKERILSVMG